MHCRDQNGAPITLGKNLASGGEGTIYLVEDEPSLVAKVYHKTTEARIRKLAAMIANPPDDPMAGKNHTSIAWPVSLLWPTTAAPPGRSVVNHGKMAERERQPVGYLMPRVEGMRPIFDFYNPGVRRKYCPLFDYGYLHGAARNLAAAVNALHARGYVIGDVNESNILVSNTALATLVDTDSFQVRDAQNGTIHRCPVGKPEFTPPELQGRVFAEVDRTPEHDLFGLGVLAFQLLMEGVHPFAGKFRGAGDPPELGPRISSGHFPHDSAGCRHYGPLPSGMPFSTLNPTLQGLFLRCFVDGHRNPKARPDALTWLYALQGAADNLAACPENAHHRYSSHLGSCPWCERKERLGGLDVFPSEDAVLKGEHLRPSVRRSSGPQTARTQSYRSGPSSPTPSSSTVRSSASQIRRPAQPASSPQPVRSPASRIAAWWPLIRRMTAAHPRMATAGVVAAAALIVIAAIAIHRGTVTGAYRDALAIAQNEAAPEDGIAALRSVLAKYPNARQAAFARSQSTQIVGSVFTAAFKRAETSSNTDAAIKEIEGVMSKFPDSDQIEPARNKIAAIRTAKKMQADASAVEQKKQDAALEADISKARSLMSAGACERVESLLTKALKENPRASRAPDAKAVMEEARRMLAVRQKAEDLWPEVRKDAEWVLSLRSEHHPAKSLLLCFTSSERANWKRAADGGCPEAQLLTGWCYDLGVGGAEDRDMAAYYYDKAAEQGNALALFKLFEVCHLHGGDLRGLAIGAGFKEAYLRGASERGLGDAQEILGLNYYDGKIKFVGSDVDVGARNKNRTEAARWFRKAAEQGCPAAQCSLGYMCVDGDGVTKDLGAAVTWFRKAAEQGNSAAQNNLGVMYATGAGIKRDTSEALRWIAKASENEASRNVADSAHWAIERNLSALRSAGADMSKLGLVFTDINECQRRREVWSFHSRKEEPLTRPREQTSSERAHSPSASTPTAAEYKRRTKDTKPSQMVEYVRQCADLGVPEAQLDFAKLCASGEGVPKDDGTAFKWYYKAADQGGAEAQNSLGWCYQKGLGVVTDKTQAVKWYRQSANQGYAVGQCNLGWCYGQGYGVAKDVAEGLKWQRRSAEQGYAMAQCNVAVAYRDGEGVAKDAVEAVKWLRKAADQEYAGGQYGLGMCYAFGIGVEKNEEEAVVWYRKAAAQGFADAYNTLGVCYLDGQGTTRNPEMAVVWFKKAAAQGEAYGQNSLGLCYAKGDGVEKNEKEAARLFRSAAEQGHVGGQYNLAVSFAYGRGVEKSVADAIKWYRKAADQGEVNAKQRLAELGVEY